MSNIVNLNKARKARQRTENRRKADSNAVKFGLTKAQKLRNAAERDKARKDLDAHQKDES